MIPIVLHFVVSQIERRRRLQPVPQCPPEDLDMRSLPRARMHDDEVAYLGDRITEWITVDVDDLEEIIE